MVTNTGTFIGKNCFALVCLYVVESISLIRNILEPLLQGNSISRIRISTVPIMNVKDYPCRQNLF
jgi:hypothetical protein